MSGAEAIGELVALLVRTMLGERGRVSDASYELLSQALARSREPAPPGDAGALTERIDAALVLDALLMLVVSEAEDGARSARLTSALGPERTRKVAERLGSAARVAARTPVVAEIRSELTPREHDVLAELQWHQSLNVVAARLNVSVNTVKTHVRSIYRKLQVDRRSKAVEKARRLKLL
jgi:LuxR family maltose regulon positive regulatory protein